VVDALYDFMPSGNLPVPNGDDIIPEINNLLSKFKLVVFTKEEHPHDMQAFASNHDGKKPLDNYINANGDEDILWPDHCVKGTKGAEIHNDIDFSLVKGEFNIFSKGLYKEEHPYSGFGAKELLPFLKKNNIQDIYLCGLATDYCVKETALDAKKHGFNAYLIRDACRGISPNLDAIYTELENSGVEIL